MENIKIIAELDKLFRKLGFLDTRLKGQADEFIRINTLKDLKEYFEALCDLGDAAKEVHGLMVEIFEVLAKLDQA